MNFGIPNTPDNRVLSANVNRRIKSDASLTFARATMYRLLGFGAFSLLLGAGVGAALFGYSYVTDGRTSIEKLSAAMADALGQVKLGVTGSVPLDTTGAKVGLDTTGATVGLDSRGATIGLDTRGATIGLDTRGVNAPLVNVRPTGRQLSGTGTNSQTRSDPAPSTPDKSDVKVVTNFTIFKSVDIGKGKVMTGWNFESSEDPVPSQQFCYYTETNASDPPVWARYDLARDGKSVPVKGLPVDTQKALANCTWFEGNPNRT